MTSADMLVAVFIVAIAAYQIAKLIWPPKDDQ